MNKQKLYWIFQIVGWSFYALLNITGISLQSTHFIPAMAWPIVFESFFFFFTTHTYRRLSKKKVWLQLPTTKLMSWAIVHIVALSVTVYFVRVGASYVFNLYSSEMLSLTNILGNLSANFIVLIIWSSVYFAFHYFEKNTQSLKYEVAMNEMKLNQLKSQLNPHFIFNALNSIRALVDEEPSKSKRAINHLSNILRTSLVLDKKRLTSLGEEMETTKDYLALESIRYEERLKTKFIIEPGTLHIPVPPMMLQTLVENGIKHGISKLTKGGIVSVETKRDYNLNQMIIEIRNSGQYYSNRINGTGQGLRNTRQRLELIYGDMARLEINNENENTVLTTVQIPLNEQYESFNN
ncbi:MAG: histidine kinase [Bacteroidota bacterium]